MSVYDIVKPVWSSLGYTRLHHNDLTHAGAVSGVDFTKRLGLVLGDNIKN